MFYLIKINFGHGDSEYIIYHLYTKYLWLFVESFSAKIHVMGCGNITSIHLYKIKIAI